MSADVLKQCTAPGIRRIRLQLGLESEADIGYCRENNMHVVYNICAMMD
ncbi:MAG: CoA-binding protein [Dehalococcoidales bacterium]|nr:CoA-binding protein [Dehalococcoidales bacterium]